MRDGVEEKSKFRIKASLPAVGIWLYGKEASCIVGDNAAFHIDKLIKVRTYFILPNILMCTTITSLK